jgi:hypothetical protein
MAPVHITPVHITPVHITPVHITPVDMTTPPGASAHEGVPCVDARSPLGEWRYAAPAERYSAKAVDAARGTLAHRQYVEQERGANYS